MSLREDLGGRHAALLGLLAVLLNGEPGQPPQAQFAPQLRGRLWATLKKHVRRRRGGRWGRGGGRLKDSLDSETGLLCGRLPLAGLFREDINRDRLRDRHLRALWRTGRRSPGAPRENACAYGGQA